MLRRAAVMVPVLVFVLLVTVTGLPGTINIGEFSFMCLLVISNPLKPAGYHMYHQFNIHKFHVLLTKYFCELCVDLKT
jgi:hypothetical protein